MTAGLAVFFLSHGGFRNEGSDTSVVFLIRQLAEMFFGDPQVIAQRNKLLAYLAQFALYLRIRAR